MILLSLPEQIFLLCKKATDLVRLCKICLILRRVVLVDNGEEVLELVNPELVETSGEQEGPEGCLSLPGKYGLVKRPMYAKVRAQDRNGNWFETDGEALTARCFCHELYHLDGIVYTEVMERFLTDEELEAE